MATPRWVQFSILNGTIERAVGALQPVLERNDCDLFGVDRLGWDAEVEEFGVVGERVNLDNEAEVFELAREWTGIGLCYKVSGVNALLYIYFWRCNQSLCTAIEISPSMVWFESEDLKEGEWLEKFLIAACSSLGADVCGYGSRYGVTYVPLDPDAIVSDLKRGVLLALPPPSFHMISSSLLTEEEVNTALGTHGKNPSLRYLFTTTGYHVFSDLS